MLMFFGFCKLKWSFMFLKVFLVWVLLYSFAVFAQPVDVIVCNNCTSNSMKTMAERTTPFSPKSREVIVINMVNKAAEGYTVYKVFEGGEPQTYTYSYNLTAQQEVAIENLYKIREEIIRSFPSSLSGFSSRNSAAAAYTYNIHWVSQNVITDPYDFALSSSIQKNIYDHFMTKNSSVFFQLLNNTVQIIKIPNMLELGVQIKYNFQSRDGEYLGYAIVSVDPNKEKLIVLSMYDQMNNIIPMNKAEASGHFSVGVGSHHERFVNYMNNKFNIDWSMMSNENKYECKVIEIMTSDKRVEFVFRCN